MVVFFVTLSFAKPLVVSSFSVLQNIVQEIAGDSVESETIVPNAVDPHTYQPTPSTGKLLQKADLIILNGFDFECWIKKFVEATYSVDKVVYVTAGIKPRQLPDGKMVDPHAWQSPKKGIIYVENILKALINLQPKFKTLYQNNANKMISELKLLDNVIRKRQWNNIILTTHDAFGYLGNDYKIQFVSPMGVSTDSQPSPKTIQKIIDQVKTKKIKAIFIENIANSKQIESIVKETNTQIFGQLYADSLSSKDGPASTYLKMLWHNWNLINCASS